MENNNYEQVSVTNTNAKDKGTVGLICGIISILLSGTGLVGLICAIIGLTQCNKAAALGYEGTEVKAGKICSIIGIIMSVIAILMLIGALILAGSGIAMLVGSITAATIA